MKTIYSAPELEFIKLTITEDVLNVSDPMQSTPIGGGNGQSNPDSDPFGDFGP